MADLRFNRKRRDDPVYVMWQETQEWLERYGKILAIVVGVVIVGGVAAFYWQRTQDERAAQAGLELADAKRSYWQGDYTTVVQKTQEIEDQFGGTWASLDAIRVRGDALFWQGDFAGAIEAYESFFAKAPKNHPLVGGVKENLAQALESDGQHQRAAETYEEAASAIEDGPRDAVAEWLLDAAYAWKAAGNTERARELMQTVARDYAETLSGRNAEIALGEMGVVDS